MFDFFRRLGVPSIGFNIDENDGSRINFRGYETDRHDRFVSFLRRVHELNAARGFPLRVRESEGVAAAALYSDLIVRRSVNVPWDIITIGNDGDFVMLYPELLSFAPFHRKRVLLGNIFTDGFLDTPVQDKLVQLQTEVANGVNACRLECEYFRFCGGGSPSNKLYRCA